MQTSVRKEHTTALAQLNTNMQQLFHQIRRQGRWIVVDYQWGYCYCCWLLIIDLYIVLIIVVDYCCWSSTRLLLIINAAMVDDCWWLSAIFSLMSMGWSHPGSMVDPLKTHSNHGGDGVCVRSSRTSEPIPCCVAPQCQRWKWKGNHEPNRTNHIQSLHYYQLWLRAKRQ